MSNRSTAIVATMGIDIGKNSKLVALRNVLQHAHVAFDMPSGVTSRAQFLEGSQRLVDLRSTGAQ
jgi:hypothetical protein